MKDSSLFPYLEPRSHRVCFYPSSSSKVSKTRVLYHCGLALWYKSWDERGMRIEECSIDVWAVVTDGLGRILSSAGNRIVMAPPITNINNLHRHQSFHTDFQSPWNLEFLVSARLESLKEFSQFKCLNISKKLKYPERPIQFWAENIVVFWVFMFRRTQKVAVFAEKIYK